MNEFLDEPETCGIHGCEIRLNGCPECRADAMEEHDVMLSEQWHDMI